MRMLLAGVALLAMTAMASATRKTGYPGAANASTVASLGWVSQTLDRHSRYVITTDIADCP